MQDKRILILLVTTVIILLAAISTVSAADVNDTQVVASSLSDNTQTVSESQDVATSDDVKTDISNKVKTQLKTTKKVETDNYVTEKKAVSTDKTTKSVANTTDSKKSLKTAQTVYVTEGNYQRYFDNEGTLTINDNDTIVLSGVFNNKPFIFDKIGLTITGNNATLINGSYIYLTEFAENSTLSNITINTTGVASAILIESMNSKVIGNNATLINNADYTQTIYNKADNVTIANNTAIAIGYAGTIDFDTPGDRKALANTFAIFNQDGLNVLIENNTAIADQYDDTTCTNYGTIDGIELQGSQNCIINNNTVYVYCERFAYGINALGSVYNATISNNTIRVNSTRYIDGIQIGNNARNCYILNNYITGTCYNQTQFDWNMNDDESVSFGIITTSMGGSKSENMTVIGNKIYMNSTLMYGMEIYTTTNSTITDNEIVGYGNYSMGMAVAHSPNTTIENNKMSLYGNSNIPYAESFVEEIRPANRGIQMQQDSDNSIIKNNEITTYDEGDNTIAVNVDSSVNVDVENNILKANDKTGNDAVTNGANTTGFISNNNTAPAVKNTAIVTLTTPSTLPTGSTLRLTVNVVDNATNQPVNGKVVFKINGVTLKDDNNNSLIVKVVNGTATCDYVLKGYSAKNFTVIAVFANETYYRAEGYSNLSITKANVVYSGEDYTSYSGGKIVINKTIYDENGNPIYGTTQVAIKINGITVGHATVVNGVLSTTINVPSYLKAGTNTLTIVFGENNRYESTTVSSTLTILRQDAVVTINKITATSGAYVTLTASITTNVTQTPVVSGTYVFKLQGITLNNTDELGNTVSVVQKLTNGTATISTYLPITINEGTYNITVVFSGNNNVNSIRCTEPALAIKN